MLTSRQFQSFAPHARPDIRRGVVEHLPDAAAEARVEAPHRLAHFLAQLGHESAGYCTTREFHDGSNYEGRRDLGNTRPGDGKRFRGRGLIQVTGRANTRAFSEWMDEPLLLVEPERIEEFPAAILCAAWYWSSRNLNRFADRGDIEMVTRRINGGLNGFADRCNWYTRIALSLLGRSVRDVRGFQRDAGLVVDGISGPRTRRALHKALKR